MPERLLQLDNLLNIRSSDKIAALFKKLGYNAVAQPMNREDLNLLTCSTEAINDLYLIADQDDGDLQILLFQLHSDEWNFASGRMRAIISGTALRAIAKYAIESNLKIL